MTHPPYTLSIKDAADHFGFKPQTLYNKINRGELQLWTHYLKHGRKVLIIREKFIEYLFEKSGRVNNVCESKERNAGY